MDEFFLHDSKESPSNCLVCMSFTKFNFETMKDYIVEQYFHQMPLNKSKLVTILGKNYMMPVSEADFKK
jgi:hypothetical protein